MKIAEVRFSMKKTFFPVLVALSFCLILAASVFAQKNSTFAGANELTRPRVIENEAFALINRKRAALGLKELTWSDEVAKIARVHSKDMAENNYFSHRGLDGSMIGERADSLGVKKWRAIGENIAFNRGYENPTEFAVECWIRSEGHRLNLLNDSWKETGVGIAIASDGSYYFTQVFLLRK